MTIYRTCSCNWSLCYSYWKSWVTCYYFGKCFCSKLEVSCWCLFIHKLHKVNWNMILRFVSYLFLIVIVFGVYIKLSLNQLFSKHHCKAVLLFRMFLCCTVILITFCLWIWAVSLLWLVGGLNLHWCRQTDYPVFYMACKYFCVN